MTIASVFWAPLLGLGCHEDDRGDEVAECIPGEEACACNNGACLAGLSCLSDLCVEEPQSDTLTAGDDLDDDGSSGAKPDLGDGDGDGDGDSTTTGDGDGDSTTTGDGDGDGDSTTGDDTCLYNDECGPEEACSYGNCVDTDWLYFDVYVDYFVPDYPSDCEDGVGDYVVEMFYRSWMQSELVMTSTVSDCPAAWPDTWIYDSLQSYQVGFYELDVVEDDYLGTRCWVDGDGCTRVPKWVLHDGYYYDDTFGVSFYPHEQ